MPKPISYLSCSPQFPFPFPPPPLGTHQLMTPSFPFLSQKGKKGRERGVCGGGEKEKKKTFNLFYPFFLLFSSSSSERTTNNLPLPPSLSETFSHLRRSRPYCPPFLFFRPHTRTQVSHFFLSKGDRKRFWGPRGREEYGGRTKDFFLHVNSPKNV